MKRVKRQCDYCHRKAVTSVIAVAWGTTYHLCGVCFRERRYINRAKLRGYIPREQVSES